MRIHKIGRILLIAWLTLMSGSVSLAQLSDKAAFVHAVNQALLNRDTSFLSSYLAPNFAVAGHTDAGAMFRFDQIIKKYEASTMEIVGEENSPKGKLYDVVFAEKDGNKKYSKILVNAAGKVIYFSQFDLLYGLQRMKNAKLVAQIPFENRNGSIILAVKINAYNRPLRLLFDTGADGMAVNQTLADEIGLKVTRENNASVVGGHQTIQVSENNTILLDTLTMRGMGIAIFPKMDKDDTDGILGNALVRRYITHIDYDKNILSLYHFGNLDYSGGGKLVSARMPSGIMLIPGELEIVEGKKYSGNFVFDTGASYDLICFRPFVRKNKLLVSGFKPEGQAATISMGFASPTFLGNSYAFNIQGLDAMRGLPVTLMGGSDQNESWNPGAEGSIGIRLLSRYNITINIADNEIFFSPNKLFVYPQDFVLRGYQIGWDNRGDLKILGFQGLVEEEAVMKKNDTILQIGAYTAQQLQQNPNLIDTIKSITKENQIEVKLVIGKSILLK